MQEVRLMLDLKRVLIRVDFPKPLSPNKQKKISVCCSHVQYTLESFCPFNRQPLWALYTPYELSILLYSPKTLGILCILSMVSVYLMESNQHNHT